MNFYRIASLPRRSPSLYAQMSILCLSKRKRVPGPYRNRISRMPYRVTLFLGYSGLELKVALGCSSHVDRALINSSRTIEIRQILNFRGLILTDVGENLNSLTAH